MVFIHLFLKCPLSSHNLYYFLWSPKESCLFYWSFQRGEVCLTSCYQICNHTRFVSPQKSNHSGQTHSSTLGFICSLHISGSSYSVLDLSLIWILKKKLAARLFEGFYVPHKESMKVYILFSVEGRIASRKKEVLPVTFLIQLLKILEL